MRVFRAGVKPAFGLVVVIHGMAHAMLPREWAAPERLALDFMPLILFSVGSLGFILSGLGLLGLRPFTSMLRPVMVVAAAYSLVLIWRFGQGGLWWLSGIDVALFLIAITGLYRRLPAAGAIDDRHELHAAHAGVTHS
jgi:hypothetical protein